MSGLTISLQLILLVLRGVQGFRCTAAGQVHAEAEASTLR
jgi:hypothetical protein